MMITKRPEVGHSYEFGNLNQYGGRMIEWQWCQCIFVFTFYGEPIQTSTMKVMRKKIE